VKHRPADGSVADPGPRPDDRSQVSVIMANYCGGQFLAAAIHSVLTQTHGHLELIVVDDASTDDSADILSRLAQTDDRLRIILLDTNGGAAVARNRALEIARGEWIAIVDSDDILHPNRLEWLLGAAQREGADIVADDLVPFGAVDANARTLLQNLKIGAPRTVNAAALVRSDTGPSGVGSFGYLKPMVKRSRIKDLRYDTRLTIGEDFDFYLRLLLDRPPMYVLPMPLYLYRRHSASLSHRLSEEAISAMIASNDDIARRAVGTEVASAAASRGRHLHRALRYERLVTAIKGRDIGAAMGLLLRDPMLVARLIESLSDRRRRAGAVMPTHDGETSRTVILGTGTVLDTIEAPPNAVRIDTGPLPRLPEDDPTRYRDLACKLNGWAGQGPLDLVAIGSEGAHAIGYLATWRSLQLVTEDGRRGKSIQPPGRL